MKKILLLLMILGSFNYVCNAQGTGKYVCDHWSDNIFIGVGGGIQGCVNPNNFDYGFGKAITPVITLQAGKMINPIWGMRMQFAGLWSTLYSKYNMPAGEYNKIKNKKYLTAHLDMLYNMSNAFFGYNPDRVFTMSAFVGPGLTFAKAFGDQSKINALINGSVGLLGTFCLSPFFDINIEARGEVSPSIFGRYSNSHTDGAVSVTAGIVYTFGGKKFVACDGGSTNIDAINGEMNTYRKNLENTEAKLKDVELELDKAHQETEAEKAKMNSMHNGNVVEVAGPRAIFFKIGQSKIDDYGMVNIKLAAKIMNAYPNKVYKITGYADKATGSPARNKQLSTQRAQAVYNALLNEGVSKDQMQMVSEGGTSNMWGKNFLNRVTIME